VTEPAEKIVCAKCGSVEFEITDGIRRGQKMERKRAARIIGDLLHLHRVQFQAFGSAVMDPDLHREARAYVAEAEKGKP
jgi:hypothetical protein